MTGKAIVKELAGDVTAVYAAANYYIELNSARILSDIDLDFTSEDRPLDKMLAQIEEAEKITLEEKQKLAIKNAVNNGVAVITGGPGTGKTTTINAMIKIRSSVTVVDFLYQELDVDLVPNQSNVVIRDQFPKIYEFLDELVSNDYIKNGDIYYGNHWLVTADNEIIKIYRSQLDNSSILMAKSNKQHNWESFGTPFYAVYLKE
jgi:Cdc6-like AAA superfamily ATPase